MSDFKAKMHQIRFQLPLEAYFYGPTSKGGERKEGTKKGRETEGEEERNGGEVRCPLKIGESGSGSGGGEEGRRTRRGVVVGRL